MVGIHGFSSLLTICEEVRHFQTNSKYIVYCRKSNDISFGYWLKKKQKKTKWDITIRNPPQCPPTFPSRQSGSKLAHKFPCARHEALAHQSSCITARTKKLLLVSRSFSTYWTSWAGRLSRLCDYSQRSGRSTPNLDIQMCECQHLCNDCFSHKQSVISKQEEDSCTFTSLLTVCSLFIVRRTWNWWLEDGAINI